MEICLQNICSCFSTIVCASPYFVRQADHHPHLGFYPQCPKVLLPSGSIKRRGRPICKIGKALFYNGNAYDHTMVPSPDIENLYNGAFNNGGSATNHHVQLEEENSARGGWHKGSSGGAKTSPMARAKMGYYKHDVIH
ncbi:hypothetical protein J1N35_013801 [Gossypium stocksii]|uniref:Uncharacterized protein n=1 Tax=Gossypium stocksii TaxID=47602 RepID=A0A9D3VT31_9ROSI|nr:hypothetical protein J1N35_013801 [Gossypium stocksii]